jgi:hypothetical protein
MRHSLHLEHLRAGKKSVAAVMGEQGSCIPTVDTHRCRYTGWLRSRVGRCQLAGNLIAYLFGIFF